jgi:hypothetical protein
MAMAMKKFGVGRSVVAACAVALAALAVACAPEPAGPPGPTTTTSTTLVFQQPTGGVWTNFNMNCLANVAGTNFPFSQYASVNVTAPATVQQGETFYMMVTPGPFIPPTQVEGYTLSSLVGMTIRFPLSPNMELIDTVMSSSINAGPGYPSVTVDGNDLVYRVPGPFQPGAEVQMPQVRLEVKATGEPGSFINTTMTGMWSTANVGIVQVPTSCTPPPVYFFSTYIVP